MIIKEQSCLAVAKHIVYRSFLQMKKVFFATCKTHCYGYVFTFNRAYNKKQSCF